jgi:hypothetical protein
VPSSPLRLCFDVRGSLLEAARACEAEVFLSWYGNTPEQLDDEYGGYTDSSVFIALADDEGNVAGTCRVIVPGPAGLKTLHDIGGEPWGLDGVRSARAAGLDLTTTWDVATLGVRDGAGAKGVMAAAALYHGLVLATRVNQVSSLVSILDERVRMLLRSVGVVTHPLPGATTAPYLGSKASTPVYGKMVQALDTWRRIAPEAFRLIAHGNGLHGVRVPDPAMFVLGDRRRVIDVTEPSPLVPAPASASGSALDPQRPQPGSRTG